jgi:hypothetical protein
MNEKSSSAIVALCNFSKRFRFLMAAIFLSGITIGIFGPVLFSSEAVVLSKAHTDLFDQFAYWRHFGFNELRQGNLALWNPYVFSGMPFLGGFQSGMLYPINAIFLVLPLAKAINLSIAVHVFLIGFFMFLWAFYRRLHPWACMVSAVLVMFCGPYFMQIYAGHLPHLCTMTWAPLILLSIDRFLDKRSLGWCLVGMGGVAMQILAGYPQHVFFTGIASSIYFVLCFFKSNGKFSAAFGFLVIYVGACLLGAIQLLPGIQVAEESVRSNGVSYEFIARFSFPPENLLTLLSPDFFGNDNTLPYWGRFYFWEMSFFVGIIGLVLAVYGAFFGRPSIRRFSTAMSLILLVLALGKYTPFFELLYTWVPGFSIFRGSSKFLFQTSLFVAMLSAVGLDQMIRSKRVCLGTIYVIVFGGLLVGGAAIFVRYIADGAHPNQWWQQAMYHVYATGESYLAENHYLNADFLRKAGLIASKSLVFPAATLFVLALLFFMSRRFSNLYYVIGLFAMAEIFSFTRTSLATFDLTSMSSPVVQNVLAKHSGDFRVLNLVNGNMAMSTGVGDIWGYDSVVLRRYAEFMTFTQGSSPDEATQYVKFSQYHPLYKMLRCRFGFIPTGGRIGIIDEKDVMPRLLLIQNYQVMQDRDAIFERMEDDSFDPRKQIILETQPSITPVVANKKGTASIINFSTDHLEIEADLPGPAILLITDAYSRGWHALPLPGSCQKEYQVMPANYILKAIPLRKGRHRIHVVYEPLSFEMGKWITAFASFVYILLTVWHFRRFFCRSSGELGARPMQ